MSVCISSAVSSPLMTDDSLTCPQCPKSFTSTKLLQQHQQMFHTDKAFICETCGKAFRFRSNLAEHRSVHTALKPYVCKFCGKSSRLKGNLTKHILKHHKKEQNEAIGKDDIIVKKDNGVLIPPSPATSASTPSSSNAVNINNNSIKMEIDDNHLFSKATSTSTTTNGTNGTDKEETPLLPRELTSEQERSILISLGLDYSSSLDLRDTPETSVSPDNIMPKIDIDTDFAFESAMTQNTVGGEASLVALIAQVQNNNSPNSNDGKFQQGTQCPECGKHVRKSSHLAKHMSEHHGFPSSNDGNCSDEKGSEDFCDENWQSELRAIATAVCDLRAQQLTTPKIEQCLVSVDARISRLEKNMEMALNSIYTLVQLQTGMTTNVNRFREESSGKLDDIKEILDRRNSDE